MKTYGKQKPRRGQVWQKQDTGYKAVVTGFTRGHYVCMKRISSSGAYGKAHSVDIAVLYHYWNLVEK